MFQTIFARSQNECCAKIPSSIVYRYETEPRYEYLLGILRKIIVTSGVDGKTPFDWENKFQFVADEYKSSKASKILSAKIVEQPVPASPGPVALVEAPPTKIGIHFRKLKFAFFLCFLFWNLITNNLFTGEKDEKSGDRLAVGFKRDTSFCCHASLRSRDEMPKNIVIGQLAPNASFISGTKNADLLSTRSKTSLTQPTAELPVDENAIQNAGIQSLPRQPTPPADVFPTKTMLNSETMRLLKQGWGFDSFHIHWIHVFLLYSAVLSNG